MASQSYSDFLIIALYAAPLLVAAGCDLARYRIPNTATAAVAASFLICAVIWGQNVHWLSHVGAGMVVLAVGLVLYKFRIFGGGDIKLLAALSLWFGLTQSLFFFLFLTSIFGAALALILVVLRHACTTWAGPWQVRLPLLFQPGKIVPYGVAAVAAALYMAPHVPELLFFR